MAGQPEHELEIAAAEGRYTEEGWRVRKDGSKFMAEVMINAIRDEVRRRYRLPATVQLDDLDLEDSGADPDLISQFVEVRGAIARLSASDAELIGCRYGLGMSNEAIALAMRQTPGAIATAMHRALRRLREEVTR